MYELEEWASPVFLGRKQAHWASSSLLAFDDLSLDLLRKVNNWINKPNQWISSYNCVILQMKV